MFAEAVLPNLVLFAIGQVFSWLYLRGGRFWVGAGATAVLWIAIDWWLLARFVFGVDLAGQSLSGQLLSGQLLSGQCLPLVLMQLTALVVTSAWLWAVVRRRRAAKARSDRFRVGIGHLLANRLEPAGALFGQLTWSDPWDVAAWIARGDVARRSGEARRARWCYRRAIAVDTAKKYGDLLAARLRAAVEPRPIAAKRAAPVGSKRRQRPAKTG